MRMTIRQRKQMLYAAAALLVVLAFVCAGLGVILPVTTPTVQPDLPVRIRPVAGNADSGDPDTPSDRSTAQSAAPGAGWPELDRATLRRLAGRPWRQPLFEPTEPEPNQPEKNAPDPAPSITLRLIGTAHEPGRSVAILRKSDGSTELCERGQSFTDRGATVTVTDIGPRAVTVEVNGSPRELTLPEDDTP